MDERKLKESHDSQKALAAEPMSVEKIDCFECQHFYITWDKAFPRGCKAFRCKSEKMPSVVVYEASGRACLQFTKRKTERIKSIKPP